MLSSFNEMPYSNFYNSTSNTNSQQTGHLNYSAINSSLYNASEESVGNNHTPSALIDNFEALEDDCYGDGNYDFFRTDNSSYCDNANGTEGSQSQPVVDDGIPEFIQSKTERGRFVAGLRHWLAHASGISEDVDAAYNQYEEWCERHGHKAYKIKWNATSIISEHLSERSGKHATEPVAIEVTRNATQVQSNYFLRATVGKDSTGTKTEEGDEAVRCSKRNRTQNIVNSEYLIPEHTPPTVVFKTTALRNWLQRAPNVNNNDDLYELYKDWCEKNGHGQVRGDKARKIIAEYLAKRGKNSAITRVSARSLTGNKSVVHELPKPASAREIRNVEMSQSSSKGVESTSNTQVRTVKIASQSPISKNPSKVQRTPTKSKVALSTHSHANPNPTTTVSTAIGSAAATTIEEEYIADLNTCLHDQVRIPVKSDQIARDLVLNHRIMSAVDLSWLLNHEDADHQDQGVKALAGSVLSPIWIARIQEYFSKNPGVF